jgi:hypothetical protein
MMTEFNILVDGRFAPLFQEDENLWIVEKIMAFSDFTVFLEMMSSEVRKGGGGRDKYDYKSRK